MEKMLYGLTVAVIGIAIVFACLLLIIISIKIMSLVVGRFTKKPELAVASTQQNQMSSVSKITKNDPANNEQSLILAISAALAAYSDLDQGHLSIRSIHEIVHQ